MQHRSKILTIIISASIFLSFVILISFLAYQKNNNSNKTYETKEFVLFCGTTNLTNNAAEGKDVFNTNCAACHHLDKNRTGPALRGVKYKFNDTNFLLHFVTKEDSLLLIKDTLTIRLNKNSSYQFDHTFELTENEVHFLLDYME